MTYGGRVFIGGISSDVSKDDIGNEFGKYGKLRTVWVASKPPGFAFVEYDNDRDAEEAVKSLNGVSLFNDTKIRVEISKKRSQGFSSRGGGSGGGKFHGSSSSRGSNPSFRRENTSFKPSRFGSSSRPDGSGPRFNKRLPDDSNPRFSSQLSSSRPRQSSDSRFGNSSGRRNESGSAPRFGNGSGRRNESGGGFFSGNSSSGGFKSSNFRSNRSSDN